VILFEIFFDELNLNDLVLKINLDLRKWWAYGHGTVKFTSTSL